MKHRRLETTIETSRRMANVSLKGGKAETELAHALWHVGIRYRKNYKAVPGSPDITITKYKVAVFVDGEFWHGKDWEERKQRLKRNREYWIEKIEEIMRIIHADALYNITLIGPKRAEEIKNAVIAYKKDGIRHDFLDEYQGYLTGEQISG